MKNKRLDKKQRLELRSFVIRFQNTAKKLGKIPYFVISKNMKQLEYYLISVKY